MMRKSIPLFKVYRKDILTGDIDVFDNLDQRSVERKIGHSMAFRNHWEGGKAWERYKYIVIRIGVHGTMKEKISCSLDGDMIAFMDEVIKRFPMISSRSAVLEMALITFVCAVIDIDESGRRWDFDAIHVLFEGRCKLNAQKESKD